MHPRDSPATPRAMTAAASSADIVAPAVTVPLADFLSDARDARGRIVREYEYGVDKCLPFALLDEPHPSDVPLPAFKAMPYAPGDPDRRAPASSHNNIYLNPWRQQQRENEKMRMVTLEVYKVENKQQFALSLRQLFPHLEVEYNDYIGPVVVRVRRMDEDTVRQAMRSVGKEQRANVRVMQQRRPPRELPRTAEQACDTTSTWRTSSQLTSDANIRPQVQSTPMTTRAADCGEVPLWADEEYEDEETPQPSWGHMMDNAVLPQEVCLDSTTPTSKWRKNHYAKRFFQNLD